MKTWTRKIVGGTLVALTMIMLIPEKSFGQFGMGNTLAPLKGNDYPITFTNDSKGGHHQVATIADRNNITTLRRQPGMLCTVMDDGTGKTKTYQLICSDTKTDRDNNANWVLFGSSDGGTTTPSGNGMLYGIIDPLATNGNVGDFYVNISNNTLFGPKKSDSSWPPLQLQGKPAGPAGGDLTGEFPNPVIALNAVTEEKIVDKAITSAKLGNKAVKKVNIDDKAIGTEQLEPGTPGYVLVTDTLGNSVIWVSKSSLLSVLDGKTLVGAGTSSDPFRVNDLGILSKHLSEGAVTESKLATDAVSTNKIQNIAVTESKLAPNAVTEEKINDNAVTESKLALNAVTEEKIVDKAITSAKLGNKAVKKVNIDDKAIGTEQLEPGTPGYVLVTDTLGNSVIWVSKSSLLSVLDGKTLVGAGTPSDPFRVNDLGILSKHLSEGAVTESKLATDAVTEEKINDNAVTAEKLAPNAVTEEKIVDKAITSAKLGNKAVKKVNIDDKAIGTEQLEPGTPGYVLVTDTLGNSVIWVSKSSLLSVLDGKTLVGAGTSSDPFRVNDLGILSKHLSEGAVTESKLATDAVSTNKIQNIAVTESKLAPNAVTEEKINDNAVTESKLATDAVSTNKIQNTAVTAEKLAPNAVTEEKIVDKAITSAKLGNKAVKKVNIDDKAIGTEQLEPGTPGYVLVTDTLGNSVIWVSKSSLLSVLDGKTLVGAGTSSDPFRVNDLGILSKHLSEGAVTESKLASNAVTEEKINDNAITELKLATDAVSTNKIQNTAVTAEKLAPNAVTEEKIVDKAITSAKLGNKAVKKVNIDDKAIGTEQLEPGTPGYVLVTDTLGNSVIWVSKSSLLSVLDGKTLVGAGTSSDPFRVNDLEILSKHLSEGAVTESKLAPNAVTEEKINDNAVTESKLATDAVSTNKIQNTAVTESKLASNAVTVNKINDGAVSEAKLADYSVSNMKLGIESVTTDKIASNSVSELKLTDNAVTTPKLAPNSVTTIKLDNEAVTPEKIKGGKPNQMLVTNAEGAVTWTDVTTGGGSGGTFNGNRPIVGGPYNGINPKTNDIGKWIEAVFYPSASPAASISPTPALGTKEMTSDGGSSSVALKWKVTRVAGAEAIKDITVDGVSVFTGSPEENGSVEGTTNGTIKNNENKNFTVIATTTDGKTGSGSTGVVFQWKRYWGFVNGGDDGVPFAPTNAQIIALSGNEFGTAAPFSKTVTPAGSQKLVIAYPVQWGGNKIIVGVNDSTGAFDRTVRSFTNASGGTTDYVIYVQKDNTGAGYAVAVQ